ncbi:putative inorganic carbon transporter subunit DabA, partial [uncultured Xanthomonas sp.]|uniref:putative inorganic carbon transporter subunit DabA n=1 Tax=uncultured Xanthomonas sp. TaxID=152831 RepID=UPI0025E88596
MKAWQPARAHSGRSSAQSRARGAMSWLRCARGRRSARSPRASDWAELRPEWALAGCQAFIAAPRARTA